MAVSYKSLFDFLNFFLSLIATVCIMVAVNTCTRRTKNQEQNDSTITTSEYSFLFQVSYSFVFVLPYFNLGITRNMALKILKLEAIIFQCFGISKYMKILEKFPLL